jgi:hypothetical protein
MLGIRYREVSRLEGFSDAVFGFALTLLVVSLETPNDFQALRQMVTSFLPFALMFAMVCWIWYEHNLFFRRYGMQDAWTVFLNCILLFVVLFYVYPAAVSDHCADGAVAVDPRGQPSDLRRHEPHGQRAADDSVQHGRPHHLLRVRVAPPARMATAKSPRTESTRRSATEVSRTRPRHQRAAGGCVTRTGVRDSAVPGVRRNDSTD